MTPFDMLFLGLLTIIAVVIIVDGWRKRPKPHDDEERQWSQVWPPETLANASACGEADRCTIDSAASQTEG